MLLSSIVCLFVIKKRIKKTIARFGNKITTREQTKGADTVSYTHLDVYKRQSAYSPDL